MTTSSSTDEVKPADVVYFWLSAGDTPPLPEILGDEASVRARLASLSATLDSHGSLTALFSSHPNPPPGWQTWGGIFFVGSPPVLVGDLFRIEPYGTILFQGRQLELSHLTPAASGPPTIIGRSQTLGALNSLVAARASGIHALIGPAGLGKTTVLRRFLFDCNLPEEDIYSSSFSLGLTESLQTWKSLARLPRSEPQAPAPTEGLLDRLAGRMAKRIGKSNYVLVVLDDCQWITPTDLSIVRRLLHRLGDQMLLVLASRPVPEDSPLHDLDPVVHQLHPFGQHEVVELIRLQWPELSEPELAAAKLLQVAGGHPLLTTEIVRTTSFPQAFPNLQQSTKTLSRALELTRVCETNPALCDRAERAALGLLAHLRKAFPPSFAQELLSRAGLSGSWGAGLEARLLCTRPDGQLYFRHDLLRTASREWCPAHLKPTKHNIIATLLSQRDDHAEAAYHFEEAHQEESAYTAHLKAATSAFDHGELGSTAEHTLAALMSPPPHQRASFPHYWRGGVALYALGRHSEAADLINTGLIANRILRRKSSYLVALRGWLATILPSRTLHLDPRSVALFSKAIQGLRIAAEAHWHRQEIPACVTAVARAVSIARTLPPESHVERALSLASAALLFSPVLPARRARHLFLEAFRNAARATPDVQSEVALIAGVYHMRQRDWRKRPLLTAARRRAFSCGNVVMACRVATVEAMALYFGGQLDETVELAGRMTRYARSAENVHLLGLLELIQAIALADLDEPHRCLRAFLSIDTIIPTLHPFEFFGVSGSIGYLIDHNREESLHLLLEAVERGTKCAHLSYASPIIFTWLADSLSVATQRGDLPGRSLETLMGCIRRNARLYPLSRPGATAIKLVVRARCQSRPIASPELLRCLDEARRLKLGYLTNWIEGHLHAERGGPSPVPAGLTARCRAVREALIS